MSHLRRKSILLGVALILPAFAGCHGQNIVAQLGSQTFSQKDYLKYLEQLTPTQFSQDEQLAGRADPSINAGVIGMVEMLREAGINQLAEKKQVKPTQDEIDTYYRAEKALNPQIDVLIQQGAVSPSALKHTIKLKLELTALGSDEAHIDPADIANLYKKNASIYSLPLRYGIKMIQVPAGAQGITILNQLKASGDFVKTIQQYQLPVQAPMDGQEQILAESSLQQVPPLYNAVKTLQSGQFAPAPIKFTDPKGNPHYVVAQVVRSLPARTLTMQEVEPLLKMQLIAQRYPDFQMHAFTVLNDYMKSTTLSIYDPKYAGIVPAFLLISPTALQAMQQPAASASGALPGGTAPPSAAAPPASGTTGAPSAPAVP